MKLTKKRLQQIIAEEKVRLTEAKSPDEIIELARQRVLSAIDELEGSMDVNAALLILEDAAGLIAQAQTIKMHAK